MISSNDKLNINICKKCILPETFPGISFNDQGVCNYCRREEKRLEKIPEKKEFYRQKLDQLIAEIRGESPTYDVITAYSGGKDSSYTLKLLRDNYDLRILAMSFDNHFVSSLSWDNIHNVTNKLDVDHINFRPPWFIMKKIFSMTAKEDIFPEPTLLRASAICTACIGLVKSLVLKTALEMEIPLVAFGWSPGQAPIQSAIMKTNPSLIRQNQLALKKALILTNAKALDRYFIPEIYYTNYKDRFPHNIHPLAFFDYNEDRIVQQLNTLDWRIPTDTDTNSTNCLLNAFGNHCHLERHRFHPYVWEIANMVRQGIVDREEGIDKIYSKQDQKMVEYARKRLEL